MSCKFIYSTLKSVNAVPFLCLPYILPDPLFLPNLKNWKVLADIAQTRLPHSHQQSFLIHYTILFKVIVIEAMRWSIIRTLNSHLVCGKVPLLHTVIFLIEMLFISRLVVKFDTYYAAHPIITMMMTNALLNGIADTVAQSITVARLTASRKAARTIGSDALGIEIPDLDRKSPTLPQEILPGSKSTSQNFDFERLTRFMAYGFLMAPVQFKWFQFLSKAFPKSKENGLASALKMVAFDQALFAPAGIATFFTVMTIAEGGGRRAVFAKLREMYIPTLKANYMVWPLVQIVNFRLIPLQFQLPFVSSIGIAWTAYLSLSNAADDVESRTTAPQSPNI